MTGLKDQTAFEIFNQLEQKVDRIEAEAEAGVELAEEYSGDRLAQRFKELEGATGVDDDLVAMKRKMGLAPPPPEPAPPQQVRVSPPSAPPPAVANRSQEDLDRDELTQALAEIEAEQARDRERMKR